jgi:hypothetical protein
MQPDQLPILSRIARIEQLRESRLLVLAASHLEIELLPQVFEQCRAIGKVRRLDVLLHSRGGVVNDARRIALLLREFCDHLGFIVPFHCASSATLLALAGDEIVAGDLAMFSPIDPLMTGGADGANCAISCQDIRRFGDLCLDWFGVPAEEARQQALGLLCSNIFPPTLTAFYRSTQEVQQIGEELLAWQMPQEAPTERQRIVQHLMFGYHSHNYAITPAELRKLGLHIRRQTEVETQAWDISRVLQSRVGGAQRDALDDPWCDALIASRDGAWMRQHQPDGLAGRWHAAALAA